MPIEKTTGLEMVAFGAWYFARESSFNAISMARAKKFCLQA